jgi:hypothetical protein
MSNEEKDWYADNRQSVRYLMKRINAIRTLLDELETFTRTEYCIGPQSFEECIKEEDLDQKTIDSGFEN